MTDAELTRLAATEVMGWTVYQSRINLMAVAHKDTDDEFRVCLEHNDGVRPAHLWNPLESIADAWMLWEATRQTGKWCCLNIDSDYNHCYRVTLTPSELSETADHKPTVVVDGEPAAPRAITLAALKACGVAL